MFLYAVAPTMNTSWVPATIPPQPSYQSTRQIRRFKCQFLTFLRPKYENSIMFLSTSDENMLNSTLSWIWTKIGKCRVTSPRSCQRRARSRRRGSWGRGTWSSPGPCSRARGRGRGWGRPTSRCWWGRAAPCRPGPRLWSAAPTPRQTWAPRSVFCWN